MATFSPHRFTLGTSVLPTTSGYIDVRALLESGGARADALETCGSFTHAFEVLSRFQVPSVTLHLVRGARHMLVLWAMMNDEATSKLILAHAWPAGFFYQSATSYVVSEGLASLPTSSSPSIVDVMGFCMPVQTFDLSMITMFKPRHALQFTYANGSTMERHVFPACPMPVFPDLSVHNQNGSVLYLLDAYGIVRDKHALSVPQTYIFQDVIIDATSASKAFEKIFNQPHDFLMPPTPVRMSTLLQDILNGIVYDPSVKAADISDTSVWRKVVEVYVASLQKTTGKFIGAYMPGVHKGAPQFRATKKVIDKRDYIVFSYDIATTAPEGVLLYHVYVDGMASLCAALSSTNVAASVKSDLDTFYSSLALPDFAYPVVFPSIPDDIFEIEAPKEPKAPKAPKVRNVPRYLKKLARRSKSWGVMNGDKRTKAFRDERLNQFNAAATREKTKALKYISEAEYSNLVDMIRKAQNIK